VKRSNEPAKTIPCSECSVGLMHPAQVAYFTWLGEELISVPDFPAWVCDMCGKREYDTQALRQLSQLLSPAGGMRANRKPAHLTRKPAKKHKSAHPSASD
jgi:YgiT-type zinc finger domain-containing protein